MLETYIRWVSGKDTCPSKLLFCFGANKRPQKPSVLHFQCRTGNKTYQQSTSSNLLISTHTHTHNKSRGGKYYLENPSFTLFLLARWNVRDSCAVWDDHRRCLIFCFWRFLRGKSKNLQNRNEGNHIASIGIKVLRCRSQNTLNNRTPLQDQTTFRTSNVIKLWK